MIQTYYKPNNPRQFSGLIKFTDFFTYSRPDNSNRGSLIAQRIEMDIAFDAMCKRNIDRRNERNKQMSDDNV